MLSNKLLCQYEPCFKKWTSKKDDELSGDQLSINQPVDKEMKLNTSSEQKSASNMLSTC